MAAMPFPALPALLDSTQANFVAVSRWVLPWTPRTCEFQYFPRELRECELWQLPDSSRGGSLSGVAAVARAWAHALASKKTPWLFAQASVSRKSASLNSSWPDRTFSSTASMLSSNSSVRRRFNQALFAASFLDSAFAAVVISHDCYAYSLIGCRGIRIGGPKCTNRLEVLYACDAQLWILLGQPSMVSPENDPVS
ncbi:hypothetical protein T06_9740 [Trichinella sp. T6]|nr:hypothetical protein T06_9740 [Trichinella sp. T6]